LLRRLLELAPGTQDHWVADDLAWRALELNRPAEAVAVLEPLVRRRAPADAASSWPLTKMTAAQHMLGNYQREIEYAELGLEHFPGLAYLFFARARALSAMDRIAEVDAVVNEFLRVQTRGGSAGWLMLATARELRAHGHRQAADELAIRSVRWYEEHPEALAESSRGFAVELWTLGYPDERRAIATALWMVGRQRDAEQLISEMIGGNPDDYQLTGWLGTIAASSGDRDRALQIARNLPQGESARAAAWKAYWQAAIAAHLGEKDRAVELLAEAFSKGFPYGVYLHSTLDFEPLWGHPSFEELVRPKG
jgi:tetratricopeptide (TPR) repeat protein